MRIKGQYILMFLLIIGLLIISGCGSTGTTSESNSRNCVECHTDKERLLADLKALPLPEEEKSTESEGEG